MKRINLAQTCKIQLLLLLVLFTFCSLFSQTNKEESVYSVRQKISTKDTIKQYFKHKVPDRIDTALVTLIPPMKCPRCEGTINVFMKKYNQIARNTFTVCVIVGKEGKTLNQYLKRRSYNADLLIVDDANAVLNSFEFSSGELKVPFFLKLDISKGVLLNYKTSLGLSLDDETVMNFVKNNFDLYTNGSLSEKGKESYNRISIPNKIKQFTFNSIEHIDPSSLFDPKYISHISMSNDGKYFSMLNSINNEVYIFQSSDTSCSYRTKYAPTKTEKNKYIHSSVSDTIVLFLKKAGVMNTMYLKTTINNNGEVTISASLPEVKMEQQKDKEAVAYYNHATLIKVDVSSGSRKYINFRDSAFRSDSKKSYLHKKFFSMTNKTSIFYYFPIQKGWPVYGNDEKPPETAAANPFKDSFYENAPIFAVFNQNGTQIKEIGELDPLYREIKTGYYYSSPIIRSMEKDIYYIGDKNSGTIRQYEGDSLISQFNFFDNSSIQISPKKGHTIKKLDQYQDYFHDKVITFIPYNNKIYSIIRTKKELYLAKSTLDKTEVLYKLAVLPEDNALIQPFLRIGSNQRLEVFLVNARDETVMIKKGVLNIK